MWRNKHCNYLFILMKEFWLLIASLLLTSFKETNINFKVLPTKQSLKKHSIFVIAIQIALRVCVSTTKKPKAMPEHIKIDYLNNNGIDGTATRSCWRRCGCYERCNSNNNNDSKARVRRSSHHPICRILCRHNCCYIDNIDMVCQFGEESTVQLSNGVRMPYVGLGTSHSGGYAHSAVVYALKECGYRLIDTAKRYGTEQFIKQAIEESGISRDELFLVSKLWPTDYGFESTKAALRGSLSRLGIDYIDSFLIHWPEVASDCKDKYQTLSDTWRALESLYDDGLCKAIGVSNYNKEELEKLLSTCSVVPHINQIEFHPYQCPQDLLDYCDENKIQIQGYCPLGKGHIVNEPPIAQIAKRVERSAAQVLIRWSIQRGVPTIPKSTKEHRVKENIGVYDFTLTQQEMDVLNGLHDGRKYIDGSKIKDKIDSKMPDGYKLNSMLEMNGCRRISG